ncbi:hypothetical protein P4200_32315 [Pseudomonas aeruginosa]|nr:hypothetical protein [Pseudomonas aeruginosa]
MTQAYEDAGLAGSVTAGVEGVGRCGTCWRSDGGRRWCADNRQVANSSQNLVNAPIAGVTCFRCEGVRSSGQWGDGVSWVGAKKDQQRLFQNFGGRTANDLVAAATEPINKRRFDSRLLEPLPNTHPGKERQEHFQSLLAELKIKFSGSEDC